MVEINWHPSRRELRVFAVLLVVFFGIVAGWVWWRTAGVALPLAIFGAAAAVGITGFLRPAWMRIIYVAWMAAVWPIGWVVSHAVMAAVFYLVVTPVGLLMRLVGRDPMQRRFDPAAKTYWQPRRQDATMERYFRQF